MPGSKREKGKDRETVRITDDIWRVGSDTEGVLAVIEKMRKVKMIRIGMNEIMNHYHATHTSTHTHAQTETQDMVLVFLIANLG